MARWQFSSSRDYIILYITFFSPLVWGSVSFMKLSFPKAASLKLWMGNVLGGHCQKEENISWLETMQFKPMRHCNHPQFLPSCVCETERDYKREREMTLRQVCIYAQITYLASKYSFQVFTCVYDLILKFPMKAHGFMILCFTELKKKKNVCLISRMFCPSGTGFGRNTGKLY